MVNIPKQRCKESGMTLVIGMHEKRLVNAATLQVFCILLFFICAHSCILAMIIAPPFSVSVTDHSFVMSWRSLDGHLHQIHEHVELVEFAAFIPKAIAKDFVLPPKNKLICRCKRLRIFYIQHAECVYIWFAIHKSGHLGASIK